MNEIVAACQFRDFVIIFTRSGEIWKMYTDPESGNIQFIRFHNLFPGA